MCRPVTGNIEMQQRRGSAMADYEKMQLFEDQPIRTAWDEEQEEWYFSVVDVVGVLTGQDTPRGASNYWAILK